mgnify:CR=1 FL=1
MKQFSLLITEDQIDLAKKLLKKNRIIYNEGGCSKVKDHSYNDLEEYAKYKGFKNITEAIGQMGGGRAFRMNFNKEYKSIENG